jgi:hypothetical protein
VLGGWRGHLFGQGFRVSAVQEDIAQLEVLERITELLEGGGVLGWFLDLCEAGLSDWRLSKVDEAALATRATANCTSRLLGLVVNALHA